MTTDRSRSRKRDLHAAFEYPPLSFTKQGDEIHLEGTWPPTIYLDPAIFAQADRRFLKRRGSLVLITPSNGRALYQIEIGAWGVNDGLTVLSARLLRARKDPPT